MNLHFNIRTYGLWAAFIAIPLMVNGLVTATLVTPQKVKLQDWRDAKTLAVLKPKLKELLAESRQARMAQVEGGTILLQDAQGAMQSLQKSAGRNNVQITETRMQGEEARSSNSILLELEVTGAFNKLARWMSDVESQSTFQINSWNLKPATDQPLHLSIKITAFVGGS